WALRVPRERAPGRLFRAVGGGLAGPGRGCRLTSLQWRPAPAARITTGQTMHEQLLDALRRGANGEALDAARAAVDAQPGDARALHLLALAQRATGDTAAALESIERAIGLAPEDSTLHFQRAGFLIGGRQ